MIRCPRCGLRLTNGRCPADLPRLPEHQGREYGTVQQLAHRLGADITPAMVRRWRERKGLADWDGLSFLDEATAIEAAVRRSTRGRPRRVDVGAALAA